METLNGKLNSENDWEDSALASPNNSAYRTLFVARQSIQTDRAAGTYILCNRTGTAAGAVASGGNILATGEAPAVPYFYFDDEDYKVTNKTQKLRLRAQAACNATKAAINFVVRLYPITVAGGVDELTLTLGTAVAGSDVELTEPAASSITQKNSGEFSIPVDGAYCLGVQTNATLTNNSAVLISAQLQTKSV